MPKEATMYDWKYIRNFRGCPDKGPMPDEMARHLLHGYYASISYMDAQLGRVLEELDRLGLADSTTVLLWSDHGSQMGEHELYDHNTDPNENTNIAANPKNGALIMQLETELQSGWKSAQPEQLERK